ncbi:MAG: phage major capsid protein [Planctomycetota bacterium]|jgi:hypothetical protein
MNQTIRFDAGPLEIKAADGEAKSPEFTMQAYGGGRLHLGNFPHPAVIAAEGVEVHGGADTIPILRDHDGKRPVGHGRPIVASDSLQVEGTISQTSDDAKQIIEASRNGYPWQASIGGRMTEKPVFVKAGKTVTVNGRRQSGPVYVVNAFMWTETSVVSVGADADRATTSIAATQDPKGLDMDFQEWLEAQGFEDVSDTQRQTLRAAYDAEHKSDDAIELEKLKASNALDEMRAEAVTVSKELKKISRIAAQYGDRCDDTLIDSLEAKALTGKISAETFELELLKASRPLPNGSATAPAYAGADCNAITAALCNSIGMDEESVSNSLKAEVGVKAADKAMNDAASLRGFNVHKLIHTVLHAHGRSVSPGQGIDDSVLASALECGSNVRASAGFSTVSLPGILSRVANKAMLQSYNDGMGVAREFCAETDTTDFKQFDRYRMTEAGDFEELGATGEIKSSTLTEETLSNQVKTYGRMFGITRQMLINDDLGAMLAIPSLLGKMAARTLEKSVISLLANASTGAASTNFFFSTSTAKKKANYAAGAATALDIDALGTAYKLFLDQVDSQGNPIMVEPSLLLVTNKNAVNARKLFNDAAYRFTNADTKETTENQWQGMFRPLVSPFLSQLATTEDEYYLLPTPTDTAVINIAYLRGQRSPVISQSDVDFNQLGVQMRGVFDFGVALWDQRLAVKMAGQ